MLKQRRNHAKSRIKDPWKRWVPKQGLNYVKLRVKEAAAQAHPESPPGPKTFPWTASFVLRASFAVAKCVACVSTCVHEKKPGTSDPYTWNFLCAQRDIMRPKTATVSHSKHMHLSPCAAHKDMFLQNDRCDIAPPDRLMHTKMLRFRHEGTRGSQSTRKKTWILVMINKQVHAIKNCCFLSSHVAGTLGSHSVRNEEHLHATRLLRSHAASTLGSLSVCQETCSCEKTVAISRRPQYARFLIQRPDAVSTVVTRAHVPYFLGNPLPETWLRKETCSCEKTVAISRRPQYIDDF